MQEDIPNRTFADFLTRNSVRPSGSLPLVHTTKSYHVREIVASGKLVATTCDVFTTDKLNYFFAGRPAYKYAASDGDSPHWELPCCFIFDFKAIGPIKRVFPFDSGAFSKGLYPSYITMMNRDDFDVSSVPDATERIIGAFFGSPSDYMKLNARSVGSFNSDFDVDVLDAEVSAVHRLSNEKSANSFDDRRLTVEVQTDADVELSVTRPLAVIAPNEYFDNKAVLKVVESDWGAQPLGYDITPLNVRQYYSQIYSIANIFYKDEGLI